MAQVNSDPVVRRYTQYVPSSPHLFFTSTAVWQQISVAPSSEALRSIHAFARQT